MTLNKPFQQQKIIRISTVLPKKISHSKQIQEIAIYIQCCIIDISQTRHMRVRRALCSAVVVLPYGSYKVSHAHLMCTLVRMAATSIPQVLVRPVASRDLLSPRRPRCN